MKHSPTETISHLKVLLFFVLIGAEVGLTWLSGDMLILNAIAVVVTAYATYQLDNIFDWMYDICTREEKKDEDGDGTKNVPDEPHHTATELLGAKERNMWW